MTVELHLVSRWGSERVVPILEELQVLLRKFVEAWPGDVTFESLCQDINDGNTQLWIAFEDKAPKFLILGSLKTIEATGVKRYEIKIGVGEFRNSELYRIADIEKYAAKRGADEIEMTTLPGFRRVLTKYGYKPILETIRKQLKDAR